MPGFELKIPEWFSKLLSPRPIFAVWALVGILLFCPRLVTRMGLSGLVAREHDWLAIGFIVLGIFLLTYPGLVAAKGIYRYIFNKRADWRARKHLHDLPPDQKVVLRMFVPSGNSHSLHPSAGAVNILEAYGILYRAASLGNLVSGFSFAIAPWALKYLRRHPELLE